MFTFSSLLFYSNKSFLAVFFLFYGTIRMNCMGIMVSQYSKQICSTHFYNTITKNKNSFTGL